MKATLEINLYIVWENLRVLSLFSRPLTNRLRISGLFTVETQVKPKEIKCFFDISYCQEIVDKTAEKRDPNLWNIVCHRFEENICGKLMWAITSSLCWVHWKPWETWLQCQWWGGVKGEEASAVKPNHLWHFINFSFLKRLITFLILTINAVHQYWLT